MFDLLHHFLFLANVVMDNRGGSDFLNGIGYPDIGYLSQYIDLFVIRQLIICRINGL